ncbi:uncharacterized protein LOC127092483 [Lathyrus oleraceus]|uniref:Dynein light chain n=1 Tax=Pisum sativum TaxID=3888 RepID=A0A9D4W1Z0_PEA|nr:uncharacterized protein LOC127092483 [Pisum sativum]KAI5394529.1 hypothetical protein KIW84_061249 [Pisum sativum]
MEEAEKELERRSKFLNSLIQNKKKATQQQQQHQQKQQDQEQEQEKQQHDKNSSIHVRACDMSLTLQKHAFQCARDHLDSKPSKKIDSKHLALALKKEFDSSYGPAWHCIVGTSFGSYVTHSVGGFLYFSIDKVHVLLFKTAVAPLNHS